MLEDVPELDTLVVAVGGGGLIARHRRWRPRRCKPASRWSACRRCAFPTCTTRSSTPRCRRALSTIAEGIAVGTPGRIAARDHRALRRRHRAGGRGRHRAGDRDAAGDREDAGRRRGRRRPGGLLKEPDALCRPQGRAGAGRRQHRPAAAGGDHRARHGARRPAGAHPRQRARRAGLAGAHHRHRRPRPAPTSTRCTTSAPSPCWRRRTWRSSW